MLNEMTKVLSMPATLILLTACSAGSQPSEGSGSPFTSGSIAATVEGSNDFIVSQTIRDSSSGTIRTTLTYTGTCSRVTARLSFSYATNGQILTGEAVDGNDTHFKLGPLGPNTPYQHSYMGEDSFTPDSVVFVISNEMCA